METAAISEMVYHTNHAVEDKDCHRLSRIDGEMVDPHARGNPMYSDMPLLADCWVRRHALNRESGNSQRVGAVHRPVHQRAAALTIAVTLRDVILQDGGTGTCPQKCDA